MSATDDTARRERAERWAKHGALTDDELWRLADEIARMGSRRGMAPTHAIVGYLAGAREEAAIKDAEIAALRTNYDALELHTKNREVLLQSLIALRNEQTTEIAALREAVRRTYRLQSDGSVTVTETDGFSEVNADLDGIESAVFRALEEKR